MSAVLFKTCVWYGLGPSSPALRSVSLHDLLVDGMSHGPTRTFFSANDPVF